jgi:flagellar M-ring protein FliF
MPDGFRELIDRLGGWRRITTLGVGLGAIALIFGVSRWATAPAYVPLFNSVSLEESAKITDGLTQAGIIYRLERGGADVLVAAQDLARARVAVAKDGSLPGAGRPGLELFDQPSYGMTDFTQRINYRRALEGELERTIGKMRGIEQAQVHLAIQETSTFRSAASPATASVVLKLKSGEDPPADVVRGISQLVASSVDRLESENVTVVDDAGRLLSTPADRNSVAGLTSRQLEVQTEVEEHVRGKAEEIVSQVVGRGNARVQVAASMNFDRMERTTQVMDPDRQVAATEQKAEIVPGAQGGAGSSNQAVTYENSKSTEVFAPAAGTVRRLTVAVLVNDRQVGAGDSARFEARSASELARLDTLVRNAVGFDPARGDQVSVVSVPFAIPALPVAAVEPPPTTLQRVQENQTLILNSAALVLAFVIGFMALRSLKSSVTPAAALPSPATASTAMQLRGFDRFETPSFPPAPDVEDPSRATRMLPELAAMQANQETKIRVSATVEQQPETAAKLVRAWMKEA